MAEEKSVTNYIEFCRELKDRLGKDAVSYAQVKRMADAFLKLAADVVLDEGRLALPGLGVWKLYAARERTVNSPKFQGVVPPKVRVTWRPSQDLKRQAAAIPIVQQD